jgi:N utilization substance protein B
VAYQSESTGDSVRQAWASLAEGVRLSDDQRELVGDVVGTLEHDADRIDALITGAASHWPLDRMSATDRSVLRSAVAELMARPGTPARVVLDEAIEIAKRYGSDESGGFVNGVLDHIARDLRSEEF